MHRDIERNINQTLHYCKLINQVKRIHCAGLIVLFIYNVTKNPCALVPRIHMHEKCFLCQKKIPIRNGFVTSVSQIASVTFIIEL